MLGHEVHLAHPRVEDVEALLALAAADDLADARGEDVHRGDGLPVVVDAHVEGLDLLRVVHHHDGTADVHLGQVALVLGLEIASPLGGELELLAGLLEDLDRLGVVHALEGGVDELLEAVDDTGLRDDALARRLLEELEIVRALREDSLEDRLEEPLGEIGVVVQVRERDLGLDHPELGEVPRRVRVLRTEGGAERVDLREGEAVGLDVELPGDGEVRLLAEEVLLEVDAAPFGARRVRHVERRDAEHLPGSLGVRGGDDRRVDPDEALVREEAVDRHRG